MTSNIKGNPTPDSMRDHCLHSAFKAQSTDVEGQQILGQNTKADLPSLQKKQTNKTPQKAIERKRKPDRNGTRSRCISAACPSERICRKHCVLCGVPEALLRAQEVR